jgi:hypothetical protein
MAGEQNKLDSAKILDGLLDTQAESAIAPYYSYFGEPYSATNMAYLFIQGAREIVGLKRQWQSVGREPFPNAWRNRYRIWVPWFRQIVKLDPDTGEEKPEKVLGGFNDVACIYTYSQTTGEAIKPKPTPKWDVLQMIGRLGMRQVGFESHFGGLQGYSRGTELAVSPIAADPLNTSIHEAAHIALGHTLGHTYEELHAPRGVMEFQAQAVAYVVQCLIGVMDEETALYSRGYIRHWLHDEHPSEQACRQVLTVADRIWRAGRVAVDDTIPGA